MKLKPGDTIAIISPAGEIANREIFFKKVDEIKALGFKIKIFPNALNKNGYLAGSDEERLEDLHGAFSDGEVSAILCSRGGYGTLRLLDKIDYNIVKNNPKIFIGSSDITNLLIAFYARANLKSFHALMLLNGFSQRDINLINNQKEILAQKKHKIFIKGEAKGILWGGNLSTVTALFGSDSYLPDDEIILFLEDINEPLYKIDKMLLQILRNKDLKNKIKGIIFGQFSGLSAKDLKLSENLFFQYAKKFDVPCVLGYSIGHVKNSILIPFGRYVNLVGSKIYLL